MHLLNMENRIIIHAIATTSVKIVKQIHYYSTYTI